MTEKQFVHKNESIINTKTDELVNASSEEGAKIITAWLNELLDDNLKKENYGNLDGLNYYLEQNGYLSSKISDLECENEWLKQQNKELKYTVEYLKSQLKNYSEVCPDGKWILNQGDLE